MAQIRPERRFEVPRDELECGIREHALEFAKHQGVRR
jgi:hypothetical protein